MDKELEKRFAWSEDGSVRVAYCTNESGEHYRLIWTSDEPTILRWAKCKCRGCIRMDVLDQGEGQIQNVLEMLTK